MPRRKLCHFLLALYCFCVVVESATKTVTTSVGQIQGFKEVSNFMNIRAPVWKYLGIPYAEPPVGKLRFAKPVPKPAFQTPYNASNFGPACPQNLMMMQMWVPPTTSSMSEDCLSLNIFVPEIIPSSANGLPVMVWIHGGAYVIGQSSIYSGENLASFGEVIIVTINYRLGPLGFLSTSHPGVRGNFGLWDQHIALKWIHTNIEYFGGNKDKITLFGESAGGASVIYHAMFPQNKGLFKRVISESGSASSAWGFGDRKQVSGYADNLGEALGCSSNNTMTMIQCLRRKPYQDIINHARVAATSKETIFRPEFIPVVDNEFITMHPLKEFGPEKHMPPASKALFSEIDLMTGINDGDGGFITQTSLLPYLEELDMSSLTKTANEILDQSIVPLILKDRLGRTTANLNAAASFVYTDWFYSQNRTSYRERLTNMSADHFFIMPSLFTAKIHAEYTDSDKTYLFQFSRESFFNGNRTFLAPGAQHGDEIPYVFGFPPSMQHSFDYTVGKVPFDDLVLSSTMMAYWTNFAKSGNPNFPRSSRTHVQWSSYNTSQRQFINFDLHVTTGHHLYARREAFWLQLAPKLLEENVVMTSPSNTVTPYSGIVIG